MPYADKALVVEILEVAVKTFHSLLRVRFSLREVLNQLYEFGNKNVGVILLCVSFTGTIIFLEYSLHIKMVLGNDELIPSFAMIMLCRELAPAVASLLLASKMGASIAAELGAMRTTEQLDAYRLLGINIIDLYVTPRLIASALSTMVLAFLSLGCAILGGWIACTQLLHFSTGQFFNSLFAFTDVGDFALCAIKSFAFGLSIPVISSTYGFRCRHGAEGVGMATTDSVVTNSIWIIILDFIITYIYSLGN